MYICFLLPVKSIYLMEQPSCIRIYADKEQIRACKNKLNANAASFAELSKILELAANEVRLKIIYLLEEEKEMCPCDLSDILEMSVPAISQHLRKMKDGNVIFQRKSGQTIFYSINPEHLKILRPFFKYINFESIKEEVK